ncbi:group II intron maturase-specific domain-containing protein [Desulfococcus sp.]
MRRFKQRVRELTGRNRGLSIGNVIARFNPFI